ncbi:GBF-interacting protein 1 [Quillaja saponaria]|uniref:GBF-interacting protein 1 n=1 Tax=Quillaja saponaria TaxID=32244 RepID=A0AAD7LVF0_QUISA|nr:GBF-interacting protein 1 [Quillaja saponaria]
MGSENKDKNVNGNGGGSQGIPSMTEKVVQNLKEIVNYPEQEIYAMLKECDMDPNHAVERLLSQDTFHEVKSKRERRKEMKETQDSRSRSNTTSLSRGGNAGSEQNIVQTGTN